jgi:hypothetical protein
VERLACENFAADWSPPLLLNASAIDRAIRALKMQIVLQRRPEFSEGNNEQSEIGFYDADFARAIGRYLRAGGALWEKSKKAQTMKKT